MAKNHDIFGVHRNDKVKPEAKASRKEDRQRAFSRDDIFALNDPYPITDSEVEQYNPLVEPVETPDTMPENQVKVMAEEGIIPPKKKEK